MHSTVEWAKKNEKKRIHSESLSLLLSILVKFKSVVCDFLTIFHCYAHSQPSTLINGIRINTNAEAKLCAIRFYICTHLYLYMRVNTHTHAHSEWPVKMWTRENTSIYSNGFSHFFSLFLKMKISVYVSEMNGAERMGNVLNGDRRWFLYSMDACDYFWLTNWMWVLGHLIPALLPVGSSEIPVTEMASEFSSYASRLGRCCYAFSKCVAYKYAWAP